MTHIFQPFPNHTCNIRNRNISGEWKGSSAGITSDTPAVLLAREPDRCQYGKTSKTMLGSAPLWAETMTATTEASKLRRQRVKATVGLNGDSRESPYFQGCWRVIADVQYLLKIHLEQLWQFWCVCLYLVEKQQYKYTGSSPHMDSIWSQSVTQI